MARIVCFGEIMMRLNPEGYLRLAQADRFEASYAGGEANVAVSLANYGHDAAFVSKVPAHEIGQNAVNALRKFGVDTRFVLRGGPRLGVYYVEKGASQRGSKVIYDRAGSSVACSLRAEYDWDALLGGADWLHITGITPALGGELPRICLDAVTRARALGVRVSCDLNYRAKLWTRERAGEVIATLMPFVDLCIANEEDAADVFGIAADASDVLKGDLDRQGYVSVARQLARRFDCPAVAITLRGSLSASDNLWSGLLLQEGEAYFSQEYRIHVVDRVGGGDSFGGGLIHALLKGFEGQRAIEFAAAASCLKQTLEFDFNLVTEQEVLALAQGNASGRVQR
ncbi:MAG: sugar kinase [Clostridia bacterium]|nr:sugar kinase [Clostridia bacterium]